MPLLIARTLKALRENSGFVSGQSLARSIGISRSGLWKHIRVLRGHGYVVLSRRSAGYSLVSSPDRPYPWELALLMRSELFSRRILYKETLDSTNSYASRLALLGAEEGTVVIAGAQTGGRGRLGRIWHSPPIVNLYTSVILRPPWHPSMGPSLTLAAGVAVAECLEDLYGLQPRIKWPNDILINGKKAAGILTEMNAEQDRINFIVLGIGLNVNAQESDFPPTLRDLTTSARQALGRPVGMVQCAAALYDHVDECYTHLITRSLKTIRERWEARSALTGQHVQATGPDKVVTGRALGLDENGALIIRTEEGAEEHIIAGDISLCSLP